MQRSRVISWIAPLLVASAAGCRGSTATAPMGGPGGTGGVDAAADATTDAPMSDAALPDDGAAPDAGGDGDARFVAAIAAAKAAAEGDATCTGITPFYWEIGAAGGALGGGSTGLLGVVKADTALNIASSSKFLWGAYVVERFKDDLGGVDMNAMTMRSGRTNFTSCALTDTVAACCDRAGAAGATTKNCDVAATEVGFFNYGGAHFQQYAADLGLGADANDALAADMKQLLGAELDFSFTQPQPAGGGKSSAAAYAVFLRKLLGGGLALHDHLGGDAVCTLPATCPQAHSSPVPRAWHYSYGHWVEDNPDGGDGAFSSPGAFGFYPWIDASKTYYGILARESVRNEGGAITDTPYYQSVVCGEAIRHAFMGAL